MSRLRPLAAALTLGLSTLLAPLAYAWTPTGGPLWPDGPVSIAFGTTPAMPSNRPVSDWDAAVRAAAAAWNGSLQRIQLQVRPVTDSAWYENGQNDIFFDQRVFDQGWPSGVLAVTSTTLDRGTRVETDIIVNNLRTWSIYTGPLRPIEEDFRRVIVHELGHLLGLDHPDEDGQTVSAIMNSRESNVDAPTADDLTGAHALYDTQVTVRPIILQNSGTGTVVQGNRLNLRVVAGGPGPLRYQWRRDGVVVPGATEATLTVDAARLEDAGTYELLVSNPAGTVATSGFRVTVTPATLSTVVIGSSSPPGVVAGNAVTIVSTVTGSAPFRYEWRRNGVPLPDQTKAQLVLSDVQFSDSGDYTLVVSNAAGSVTSVVPHRLTVTPPAPPRIRSAPRSGSAGPGETVELIVSMAVGTEFSYQYQWQKDGVDIPGARSSRYTIVGFRPEDAGRYTVLVSNAFGQVSAESVIVPFGRGDLAFVRQPAAITEHVGAAVSLSVAVDGLVASYQWYKDGVALSPATQPGATSATLLIASAGTAHGGTYSVEVSDGVRQLRSREALLSIIPSWPIQIHPAAHSVRAGTQVRLSVTLHPSVKEPAAYQWFRDGVPVSGATQDTLTFPAASDNVGRYRVRVSVAGRVAESEEAVVEIVSFSRPFAVNPASTLLERDSEQVRLLGVADEVARRAAERVGGVYIYTRNGKVMTGSPYVAPLVPSAVYTLLQTTLYGETDITKPFTLTFVPAGPMIRRHPQGGTYSAGDRVVLEAVADDPAATYQWMRDGAFLAGQTQPQFTIDAFSVAHRGIYTVAVTAGGIRSVSEPAVVELRGQETPLILMHPSGVTVDDGWPVSFFVSARRGAKLQWYKDGVLVAGATQETISLNATSATAGIYTVVATEGGATATSQPARLRILAASRPPEILASPVSEAAPRGGTASLSVIADGAPLPDRYQWYKNGVAIPGATDVKLRLTDIQPAAAGVYTVVVANSLGSVTSAPATLTVDERSRLINLATRARVGRGDDVMIAGFTISGTEPRQVLVRGIGDQLSEFGVSGVLRDPLLKIFDGKGKEMVSNDDWSRSNETLTAELTEAARQVGAFAQRTNTRDAAIMLPLPPGSYTAQVSGLANTTGVGLVEIYELGKPSKGRLINLSSRAVVGTGANILIPGLVLQGTAPRRLLIRAVGPGLAALGVTRALLDPQLQVLRSDGAVVGENNDWGEQAGGGASSAPIAAATTAVGAFPLAVGSKDAAVLLDLPAGSYTIQVSGVNNTEGIALVEVYEVP